MDSDGDGSEDCKDACPDDAGKTAVGVCGCGVADVDSDGDGSEDCKDACPEDAHKTEAGACGCGVADVDSDSVAQDGVPSFAGQFDVTWLRGQPPFSGDPSTSTPAVHVTDIVGERGARRQRCHKDCCLVWGAHDLERHRS